MADWPPPERVPSSRTYTRQACPRRGHQAYRDKQVQRTLHDWGHLDRWWPRDLVVTYAPHDGTQCQQDFSADLSDLAPPGSPYTPRVMDVAVRRGGEAGWPYRPARWHLWRAHRVMEQGDALCDRRCRPQTALDKLAPRRRRLLRCPQVGATLTKLFAPPWAKALTFLDDTLLPSTSNAVERGNRR